MGGFGIAGGGFKSQNFQGGITTVTTDGSGDGSSIISFRQKFKNNSYGVNITPNQSGSEIWSTGVVMASDKTTSGCTLYVRGCSSTSTVVKVAYDAHDDTIN